MDFLTAHAQSQPEKTAVIDDRPGEDPRSQTFAEFNSYVNQIANGLLELEIQPGSKAMWCGQNSLELMAFVHAGRKAGLTTVPLNYRLTDAEAIYVTNNSDSVFIWSDAEFAPMFERIRSDIPQVHTVAVFGGSPLEGQISEDQLLAGDSDPAVELLESSASMIYTSGTTGNPKGAVKTRASSVEQAEGLRDLIGYDVDDIYITCGPLYHSGPGGFALSSHGRGCTIVLQHRFDAEDWLRLIDKYSCSTTFSAPTPVRMACNLPQDIREKYDVSSMRVMIANAAPWPFTLKQHYVEVFPAKSLWEIYGSTELGVNTVLAPEDQMRKPGSCGKPAPFVEVMLVAEDGSEITETDTPGELFVRASSVFDTYYKAEEKFASEHRHGDWHTVGDIAYRDEEGFLFICDRKKDMIISGGMNIYPAEIEAALEQHPGLFEVAVIGVESDEWGESVLAIVVATDPELDAETITDFARKNLANYKIPRRIEFVEEIPKTGSNKILKRELRERFASMT